MQQIIVINGKYDGFKGPSTIYIGRNNRYYDLKASSLANPYHIGKDGDRSTVTEKYRVWLDKEVAKGMQGQYSSAFEELERIRDQVLAGEQVQLACYCKQPGCNIQCHGDIVKEQVECMVQTRTSTATRQETLTTDGDTMNQQIHQDILQVQSGIIVHQVNCQKVMGRGLAKAIRDKWPTVQEKYAAKQWKLGDVQLVQVSQTPLYVANIASQDGYGTNKRHTDFDALRIGLQRVNAWAMQQNLQIYIPAGLGSGLAGGRTQAEKDQTWHVVQEIIKDECPTAIICSKEPAREVESAVGVEF